MKVMTRGYRYILESSEGSEHPDQVIQFIQKIPDPADPAKLVTLSDGTTNEDVLKVLIDRLQFLQSKVPSRETAIVITRLEESLMWLEKRTADRIARKAEGTHSEIKNNDGLQNNSGAH